MNTIKKTLKPLILLATGILFLFSCEMLAPRLDILSVVPKMTPPNMVSLTLQVNSMSARTIGYTLPEAAVYDLTGEKSGEAASLLGSWTPTEITQGVEIGLSPGNWSFILQGKNSQGETILQGSIENRNIEEPGSLDFVLETLSSGTGTVDVTLSWPMDSSVSRVETKMDGIEYTPALSLITDMEEGTKSVRFYDEEIKAGDKVLLFRLLTSEDELVASVTERLRVRGNLTSSKNIVLENDHLNTAPAAPTGLTLEILADLENSADAGINLSWEDNSNTETGYRIEFLIEGNASWQSAGVTEASITTFNTAMPRGAVLKYRILAFNTFGDSNQTETETLTVPWLVTFDSNGGGTISAQQVANGQKAEKPGDPEKSLYSINGWYSDSDCTIPWDFTEDSITRNMTLYAGWSLNTGTSTPASSFEYTLSNGEISITDYIGTDLVVIIPDTINGYPVTKIADATSNQGAFYRSNITSIYIPGSIKHIGNYTFQFCANLETVILSEGLETIGSSAFSPCLSLETISLPASLTSISSDSFAFSSSMNQILVAEENTLYSSHDGALYNKAATELVMFPDNLDPAICSFPESLVTIAAKAFYSCRFSEITLPEGITTLETYTFYSCSSLEEVTLPSTITEINYNAFYYSRTLSDIHIPCTTPPELSFAYYKNLFDVAADDLTIWIPQDTINTYLDDSLWGDSYRSFYLNEEGNSKNDLVYNQEKTILVSFPNTIGDSSYTFPETLTSIKEGAFYKCDLTEVSIPEGITILKTKTFVGCTALEEVTLPSTLTEIEYNAFYNCSLLSDIHLTCTTPPELNFPYTMNIFNAAADDMTIWVPQGTINPYLDDSSWGDGIRRSYLNEEGNGKNNAVYSEDETTLITFPASVDISTYTFPVTLTTIAEGAFHDCDFAEISLPEGVTTIESFAFWSCENLTELNLPSTLTHINGNLSYFCKQLTDIYIDAETPPILTLTDINAYNGMEMTIWIPQGTLETYLEDEYWGTAALAATLQEQGSSPDFSDFERKHCAQMISMSSRTMVSTEGYLLDKDGNAYYQDPHQNYSENGFNHNLSPFEMGQYEVTYYLWTTVKEWAEGQGYSFANEGDTDYDGDYRNRGDDFILEPVNSGSWRDYIVWCNAYTEYRNNFYGDNLECCYYTDAAFTTPLRSSSSTESIDTTAGSCDNPYVNWDARGYRLPTEGEWQFAASCGGTYPYNYLSGADGGLGATPTVDIDGDGVLEADVDVAWSFYNSSDDHAVPTDPDYGDHNVGELRPNCWGLYDMSGNIMEFCWDWYEDLPTEDQTDYRGPSFGQEKIARGSYWSGWAASGFDVAYRYINQSPDRTSYMKNIAYGFRLARTEE